MDKLKKLFELKRYPIGKQKSSLSEANPEEHKENTQLSWFTFAIFPTYSLLQ